MRSSSCLAPSKQADINSLVRFYFRNNIQIKRVYNKSLISSTAIMAPKRKRSTAAAEDSNVTSSNKKPFAYLKPRVRRVSERTVKSKWTTLSEPVQEKISDMLRSLERPVIVRHRDERKRIEAQTAVGAVVRKWVFNYALQNIQDN